LPDRLTGRSREVAWAAEREAVALGAGTVGAEHLLLALARDATTAVGGLLHAAGLDPEVLRRGLEDEWERSLSAVGVTVELARVPKPVEPPAPRWGASGKLALKRAVEIAMARYERPVDAAHLLLGVLAAERGTAPRMLACAGADRKALRTAAIELLDSRR
jgi:ATP-dependent Clp protease ATP-binding subunit ClpA